MKLSQTQVAVEVVVVGGLDPDGGAGLLRDVATATALNARARVVGTAWTEQSPGVHRVEPRDPRAVAEALAGALGRGASAVKLGMTVGPPTAAAIVEALGGFAGPAILDPVLATSRGGSLWAAEPRALLPLARRATLVTPNAVEAAALAARPVHTAAEAEAAARQLVEVEGLAAVLVKGGHLSEPDRVTDVLVTAEGCWRLSRPRLPGPSPRGTGCALATAIAVALARGADLRGAVEAAGNWLSAAIAAARDAGGERHL